MPASFFGELIAETIGHFIFEVACHMTGRMVLYLVTLGNYRVDYSLESTEPKKKSRKKYKKKLQRLSEKRGEEVVVHFDLATFVGLLFWIAIGVGVWLMVR